MEAAGCAVWESKPWSVCSCTNEVLVRKLCSIQQGAAHVHIIIIIIIATLCHSITSYIYIHTRIKCPGP